MPLFFILWSLWEKVYFPANANEIVLSSVAIPPVALISDLSMFPELNDPPAERNPDNFFSFTSSFFSVSSAFDVNVQNIIIVNNTMIR